MVLIAGGLAGSSAWLSSFVRANAAEPSKVDPEVQKHFALGNDLYKEQKYADALVEYDAAYDVSKNYKILYNRGQCLVMLKREPEAIDSFQRYLDGGGTEIAAERRTQVEGDIGKLKDRLGFIVINGAPDGAVIELDGRVVATMPLKEAIKAGAGNHEITARAAGGGIPSIRQVKVVAGKQVEVQVELAAPMIVAPASTLGSTTPTASATSDLPPPPPPPPPPPARTPGGGLIAPSFMITLGVGASTLTGNSDSTGGSNKVLGYGDLGASWRVNGFWELGLYGAGASGNRVDDNNLNATYSYATYGARLRLHPIRGRRFDAWFGFDFGGCAQTWKTDTTNKSATATSPSFAIGFGVDFPLARAWALGGALRFVTPAGDPKCSGDCSSYVFHDHGFVELALRIVWSIPYGSARQVEPAAASRNPSLVPGVRF